MTMDAHEILCMQLADEAHKGQIYQPDEPYLNHVIRVVDRLLDPDDRAVAWLHDVIEDSAMTCAELIRRGVRKEIAADVFTLTRTGLESYNDFIQRIGACGSLRAKRVKICDLHENLSRQPRPHLKARYMMALALLEQASKP